ncbi:4-(cytidine 5'-diphospho)-2-C-methyl-D-erythritol kinase [Asticcacaulis sp. EMRT-3]|uniref:4-(cytidine 5'-diphospho)-2-C-methyl-D-erythritol kinase n=1 Tax=Asticcacaulis sp. EMRT-3 TaxID=3040349 RepID=UPI0024AEB0C6|nr:4-(cytidine 5'-diphospho)-2-C-methyl-D-erythritol kinase [Asticcacaulis sp. EMRT-3]MDI7774236.1 4-(cytidine 5'-diphospho)-2-C-methyl-D-erythritol kinase [Asticcacaulis sp. EMRT-3]
MTATQTARAKVNLYLHVAAPDARGWHPLQSLVMFADCGDTVSLTDDGGRSITGPFGAGLSTGEDNLIWKAVRAFEQTAGVTIRHGLHLDKQLPIASGLGGGSADAGAALRLLREAYAPQMADDLLDTIAAKTGADGVMCLRSETAFAEGYGERLTAVKLPCVPCVLVNPGVACATADVYAGFDALEPFAAIEAKGGEAKGGEAKAGFADIVNLNGLVAALAATRNDLEPAAIRLQPVIAEVLAELRGQPQTLLARMSGSGATCFALCADDESASALASRMQTILPGGWVRACRLG